MSPRPILHNQNYVSRLTATLEALPDPSKAPHQLSYEVVRAALGGRVDAAEWVAENGDPLLSLEAAVALVPLGWWWSAGLCGLSGHVSIGPDYNGSHGDRLRREFPEDKWHEGVSVDLEPGDGIRRVCLAICVAVITAAAMA